MIKCNYEDSPLINVLMSGVSDYAHSPLFPLAYATETAPDAIRNAFATAHQTTPHLYARCTALLGHLPRDLSELQRLADDLTIPLKNTDSLSSESQNRLNLLFRAFTQNATPATLESLAALSEKLEERVSVKIWKKICAAMHLELPHIKSLAAIRAWVQDPANAPHLATIEQLDLSNLGLPFIPLWVATLNLPQLKNFYCDNNQLQNLPEHFGATWTQLQAFSCSANLLQNLPEHLGQTWTGLQQFHCGTNNLDHLPDRLGETWTQLQGFACSGNHLQSLPEHLGQTWTQLRSFSCNVNKLQTLPEHLGETWTQLTVFFCENNPIQTLPEQFGEAWTQLQQFYCNVHSLDSFPKEFGVTWTQLIVFFCYNKHIQALLPPHLASKAKA